MNVKREKICHNKNHFINFILHFHTTLPTTLIGSYIVRYTNNKIKKKLSKFYMNGIRSQTSNCYKYMSVWYIVVDNAFNYFKIYYNSSMNA